MLKVIILTVETRLGNRVSLTEERWNHIVSRHPEMAGYLEQVKYTLETPDCVLFNNESYLYHKKLKDYLIVAVDGNQKFIITAFISDTMKKGDIIWKA